MGNVVVGGRAEPKQGYSDLWIPFHWLRHSLLCCKNVLSYSMKHLALCLLLLAGCSGDKKALPADAETNAAAKGLPNFTMTTLDGVDIRANSLEGKNILIFYNPDCDHCQRQAQAIRGRIKDFSDWSIYFIAASGETQSRKFASTYDLHEQKNIVFATAGIPEVVREMGSIGTPSIFVYSQEGKLIKQFDGETPVGDILAIL
jgi:peroxiredoxin